MEQELERIAEYYNVGFLTYGEYCCQKAYARGQMKKWHILCLIPNWIFELIEKLSNNIYFYLTVKLW